MPWFTSGGMITPKRHRVYLDRWCQYGRTTMMSLVVEVWSQLAAGTRPSSPQDFAAQTPAPHGRVLHRLLVRQAVMAESLFAKTIALGLGE